MSAEMISKLENMIMETMLDETLIKTKIFNPYASYYREFVLSHLTPFEEQAEENKGFSMFQSGTGADFIFDPLEEELMKRAEPILKEYRTSFIEDFRNMMLMSQGQYFLDLADEEDEKSYALFILDGIATQIITNNRLFQYKFNNSLLKLEEDYKKEVLEKIAFNKIKRNELFILGISMKVSMRDCGELIECY